MLRPSLRHLSISFVGLHLLLGACARHPAPAPGKLAPAPVIDAPVKASPPNHYACATDGAEIPDDARRICVPYAGTPKGEAQAPITVVIFSDFQCPFCGRAQATLDQLEQSYPGKLRFYFRHMPLTFHADARPAARAAVAAENQGRFWPMHDLLLAHQQELAREKLIQHARSLGLDMDRFVKDLDAPETERRIDEDQKLAKALGVVGTPNIFINGRLIRGAVPYEEFHKVVEDELQRAQRMGMQGASGHSLYAALMEGKGNGLGTPVAPVAPATIPVGQEVFKVDPKEEASGPQEGVVYKVDIKGAPVKGAKNALVTIVVFSDFQCPFCARLDATLAEVEKSYPGKLRIVWKNFPLSFHAHGKSAAEAAMAAHEQGKFWPMQAKLLENQNALGDLDLQDYAREIGLDMKRFKAAMASHKLAAVVEADIKQGTALGVAGSPATFVNGYLISGAQSPEIFKATIDKELAKASAGRK